MFGRNRYRVAALNQAPRLTTPRSSSPLQADDLFGSNALDALDLLLTRAESQPGCATAVLSRFADDAATVALSSHSEPDMASLSFTDYQNLCRKAGQWRPARLERSPTSSVESTSPAANLGAAGLHADPFKRSATTPTVMTEHVEPFNVSVKPRRHVTFVEPAGAADEPAATSAKVRPASPAVLSPTATAMGYNSATALHALRNDELRRPEVALKLPAFTSLAHQDFIEPRQLSISTPSYPRKTGGSALPGARTAAALSGVGNGLRTSSPTPQLPPAGTGHCRHVSEGSWASAIYATTK